MLSVWQQLISSLFLSLIIIHRDTCGHGPLSRKGIIFFSFFSLIIAVRPTDAAILLRA